MPRANCFITDLKMHGVFGAEISTPKPAVMVENRGNLRHADLHPVIPSLIEFALQCEVNSRTPGMIADCCCGVAHKAGTVHPGGPEGCMHFRLFLFNILEHLPQRLNSGSQPRYPQGTDGLCDDEWEQRGVLDGSTCLIVRASWVTE